MPKIFGTIHKSLRTVVTVETIWGQKNLLTYILIITHK
jgi:hypothetical protein